MQIPSFEVRSQRSISLARCEDVPQLMVIAGPNGSGKSTLLNALRSVGPNYPENTSQRLNNIYVGPHRSIRRHEVRQRDLIGTDFSLQAIMSEQSHPRFDSFDLLRDSRTGSPIPRDPWSVDDSGFFLKPALSQTEIGRQAAITTRFDRDGEIAPNSLADPWKPLRELTHHLLPHLVFDGIDTASLNEVKVQWRTHATDTIVDFDDLSSGEKSIIQMFYPLIERDLKALIAEIRTGKQAQDRPQKCVLIDEPELHLHPNLQVKVLDYLRLLTTRDNLQVIVATHSPTIVESAGPEELFLLRPAELVGRDENQLVQVATDEDRLRFLRDVFGTTANLTAMQPMIVVEGIDERDSKRAVSDRKLYRALHPGFDGVTLIAGGSKSECKKLFGVLDGALKGFSSALNAYALLDRDTDADGTDEKVRLLPVSMIENFLLDPECIWEAILSVEHTTLLRSVADVSEALDTLLTEMEADEIDRRVKASLSHEVFRPSGPADQISVQVAAFAATLQERFSDANVSKARKEATVKVSELRNTGRRREEFNGKAVLNAFYKRHLHSTGMKKDIFIYLTARRAQRRTSVAKYFDEFFAELFNPSDVASQTPAATP